MPTLVACLWRRVEAIQPGRVPTHFGPATRLRRPKSPRNQGALATSQVEMCPRTANSGPRLLPLPSELEGKALGEPLVGGPDLVLALAELRGCGLHAVCADRNIG